MNQCHTCNYVMKTLGRGAPVDWCPRCGSIYDPYSPIGQRETVPWLVERCREFENNGLSSDRDPEAYEAWHDRSIPESINLPEDRSPP